MPTTHIPECWCAFCGNRADFALNVAGKLTPQPGDAALCNTCGEWNIWVDTHSLRCPTSTEAAALRQSEPARILRKAVEKFIHSHQAPYFPMRPKAHS